MENFVFYNPVKILFGKGQIANIAAEIPADAKILLIYGGGSIKSNGVYDQVKSALAGRNITEFGGIEPNPHLETLLKAVELVRKEEIDFLLAVGGGSVLDGTKFIAAAVPFVGDPWDILAKQAPVTAAIPFGTVLTLPATGSEMNTNSVVTKWETQEKLFFASPLVFPRFSVLDPETTFSLPPRQISNGIVDAYAHVMEQYLTYPVNAPLQDRMAESILKTLIEEGPKTLAKPEDYDARANVMWCATMALNGLIGVGVPQDWATHMIGHELTALHGLDHAQTLAIVLPSNLEIRRDRKCQKLVQYAERVWGIVDGTEADRITEAIAQTRNFFESVGVCTHLSDYSVSLDTIPVIIERFQKRGFVALGEHQDVNPEIVDKILTLCA
ncbi:iron-containing alcohol dehydrogenase [Nodularia spumigena CS-591/04]|uniref:iron-containing alcohol dehydrogenase n=1 Tax=Nodularia spumigena TaxID=70799 RepID=UPI00232BF62C|nr:iron-containing alcohol dehydrogenase [Nodularia spumigena]MDB9329470.1 iron-containing alcohol dehydrogenase [Nodularia spumigena CS-591/04]MDB9348476.1 iron-containing alcohol dehydrogenase [Nodularia spumigena CS-588/01]MDB9352810.1 iron-containing alcohol dehydrogenase [Nodularia spumigena CS-588/05]MDB9361406.1 iron-containing alcohol dehydrogenase [Nodularia spumigena CS-588/02]MDB9366711.1 iron-containing alcohol dehydrogenase [Nodularia spumigena CS-588/02A10]